MADGALNSDTEATAAFEDWLDKGGMEEIIPGKDTQRTPLAARNTQPDLEENEDSDEDEDDEFVAADADAEDDADDDDDDQADAAAAGDDDEGITTLELMAKDYDVPTDQLLQNLEVEGLDGQTVSIGDALDGWRESERTFALRSQELEDDFATTRQTYDETAQASALQMNAVMKELVAELGSQYSQERLQSLRDAGDPEAYIAAAQRAQAITTLLDRGLQTIDVESARQGAAAKDDVEKTMQREYTKLMTVIPEWRDEKVYTKAMKEGADFLMKTIGFTAKEVSDIADHRLLRVVKYALLGHKRISSKGSKRVEELKRQGLKRRSPGLRSQSRRDSENLPNKARETARARLQKTGDVRDAAVLFEEFID